MNNVLSVFDGMSCGQVALSKLRVKCSYFASEIDKYAMEVTKDNYPNTNFIGNVTKVKGSELPEIFLMIGGSPCQSFSRVGDGTGFDGKSKLFFEYVRLLKEVKPKYFILENVVMKKDWEDYITKIIGVKPLKINSKLVSAQSRPRLYWTNIPGIKQPKDLELNIIDAINPIFTDIYPKWLDNKFGDKTRLEKVADYKGKANCLTASMYKGQIASYCKNGNKVYKYTPEDCEVLQTVPIGYTSCVSNTQRHKMLGNGWTVSIISHILSYIKHEFD